MLDLSRKLTDELIIGDETYQLNLSFDNILKLFAMWRDEEVPEMVKPHFALRMLVGSDFKKSVLSQLSVEEAMTVFMQIFEEHVQLKEAKEISVEYDLAGNVMKRSQTEDGKQEPSFNLELDGDYIFASFLQAYHIDLFDVQGKLHWKKFNALLAGLPEGTKFVEVIKIRKYKPQKGESQEYISEMRRLQKEYALPGQSMKDVEESNEFEN